MKKSKLTFDEYYQLGIERDPYTPSGTEIIEKVTSDGVDLSDPGSLYIEQNIEEGFLFLMNKK